MALELLKKTFKDFAEDECPARAAALSYYTIFSLPPLLILLLMLVGLIWDPKDIQEALEGQFASMVGTEAAGQIHTMIASTDKPGKGGLFPVIAGFAGLLFGATGAVMQLQTALNRAWEVAPDPEKGGIKNFVVKRIFSFGMILGLAFLLAVSLVLSAAVSAFGGMLGNFLPGGAEGVVLQVVELAISFVVLTLVFAAIFKFLPDAEVAWKDVLIGGAVTALLFVIGKFIIGLYLGQSNPGEAFGAAGALAVLLVWIYYSGLIVLLGAEFTQSWAEKKGAGVKPAKDAVKVVEETKHIREDDEQPSSKGGEREDRTPPREREPQRVAARGAPAPTAAGPRIAARQSMAAADGDGRAPVVSHPRPMAPAAHPAGGGSTLVNSPMARNLAMGVAGAVTTKVARGVARRALHDEAGDPRLPPAVRERSGLGAGLLWALGVGAALAIADVLKEQRAETARKDNAWRR